jgi:hypothetical protein
MAEYDSGDGRWSVKPTELPTLNFHQFEPHTHFSAAGPYSNNGPGVHVVEIQSQDPKHPDNRPIGRMEWSSKRGEILNVDVERPFRRLGIANTLFHEAHKIAREQGLAEPVHSNDRTDMGDAWAKQAGGKVPERMKVPKTFLGRG